MGLETVELLISWEQEFDIAISDRAAATMFTPREAGDVIEQLLQSVGRPMDRSAIDRIIRSTTLEISGMNPDHYRPDGKFTEDFGMN